VAIVTCQYGDICCLIDNAFIIFIEVGEALNLYVIFADSNLKLIKIVAYQCSYRVLILMDSTQLKHKHLLFMQKLTEFHQMN
jgi:hypothetical protein